MLSKQKIQFSLLFLFISAAIVSIFLIFNSVEGFIGIYLALGMLFIIALFPVIWELHTRQFDPLNPRNLFVLYYLIMLGIYPIYVLTDGELFLTWLQPQYNQPFYFLAIILSTIGLQLFYFGYYQKIGKVIGNRLPEVSSWSNKKAILVTPFVMLYGFISAYILFSSQGGLQIFIQNIGSWRSLGLIGNGPLIYPATGLLCTSSLIFFTSFVNRDSNRSKVLLGLIVFCLSLIPAILLGFRASLVPPILQITVLWNYLYKPLSWKKIITYGFLLFLILTMYGLVRANVESGRSGLDIFSFGEFGLDIILKPIFLRVPGTEMVVNVIQKMNSGRDYQYFFGSIFESLTILIPHSIWPEKQISMLKFGREIMDDFFVWRDGSVGESTGGLSPTVIGYLYWQMGFFGVFLGMFVLGLFTRIVYEYMRVNPKSLGRVLVYSAVMTSFTSAAESPQDGMNSLVIRLVSTILLIFILNFRFRFV
jgi:oligosaccharide repeat unit polymerase